MVKIYKLTRKENPSEIINSNRTKKYSSLHSTHNTNYKKNIKELIQTENKRKQKHKYDDTHTHNQSGGLILNKNFRGQKAPELGKIDLLGKQTGLKVLHNNKTQYSAKKFNVFTKSQYKQLKRNVYRSIRGSWLLKKFRRITSEEHELLKRMLKAHMYFARIKLIMAKLYRIIEPLYANNDSHIQKVQRKIRKIFDLQMEIEHAYKNPNERSIKSKKKSGQVVSKIIKQQDKIRNKIMNYTIFYNTKDLGSKCNNLSGMGKRILLLRADKRYRSTKAIICAIGRYRKYEAKFNRFYYLYREQYKKFIAAYPACDGTSKFAFFDAYLNIDEQEEYENKNVNSTQKLYSFEESKCDSYNLKTNTRKLLGAAGKLIEAQLGKHGKNSADKEKRIDESFIRKGADFDRLQKDFKIYIKAFKDLFENGEAYGIRHHHGLPLKKQLKSKLFGFKSKYVLAKKARFEELSSDPIFIKEFSEMIKGFGDDIKTMFQPADDEKTLKDTIIPYIKLYQKYRYCKQNSPTKCNYEYNVKQNFRIFSINMDKMQDIISGVKIPLNNNYNEYFYDKFNDENTALVNPNDKHEHNLPVVVCIQNGLKDNSIIEKSILKNLYVCVSYSYAYNSNNLTNIKKYNIIYVRKKCINKEVNDPETIRAIDQTDYFSLKDIPVGEGITIETFAKSFSAVSFDYTMHNPRTPVPPVIPYPFTNYSRNMPVIGSSGSGSGTGTGSGTGLGSGSSPIDPEAERIFTSSATDDDKRIFREEQEQIRIFEDDYNALTDTAQKISRIDRELDRISVINFSIPILETQRLQRKTNLEREKTNLEIQEIKDRAIALATEAEQIAGTAVTSITATEQKLLGLNGTIPDIAALPAINPVTQPNIPNPANQAAVAAATQTASTAISNANTALTSATNEITIVTDEIIRIHQEITDAEINANQAITDANQAKDDANSANDKTIAEAAETSATTAKTNAETVTPEAQRLARDVNSLNLQIASAKTKYNAAKQAIDKSNNAVAAIQIANDAGAATAAGMNPNPAGAAALRVNPALGGTPTSLSQTITEINNYIDGNGIDTKFKFTYNNAKAEDQNKLDLNNLNVINFADLTNVKIKEFKNKYNKLKDKNIYTDLYNLISHNNINYLTDVLSILYSSLDNFKRYYKILKDSKDFIEKYEVLKSTFLAEEEIPLTDEEKLFKKICEAYNNGADNIDPNDKNQINSEEMYVKLQEYARNNYDDAELAPAILVSLPYADFISMAGGGGTLGPLGTTKPGFTLVNIELIGSRVSDLLHIREINDFKLREKQIDEMINLVNKYTGNQPDIICGDFGGITSGDFINVDGKILNLMKDRYKEAIGKLDKNLPPNNKLEEMLKIFYKNGMDKFSTFNRTYCFLTGIDKINTNYIFTNRAITATPFYPPNIYTPKPNLIKLFDLYGGIIPTSIEFNNIIPLHGLTQNVYAQIKGKNYDKVKLYTKEQLIKIVQMIDKLMSHFTYGYKAYLRRDLGCFSFEDAHKNSYNIRKKDTLETKKNFYSMNYPAYIDVFLYQLGGFYNSSTPGEVFYSENQLPRGRVGSTFTKSLNFLKSKNFEGQSEYIKHTVIRMLLIPSTDLTEITTLNNNVSSNKKGITSKVTSFKNYMQLAKEYSFNFYRNTLIPGFEKRLSELLKQKDFIKDDDKAKYKKEVVEKVQSDIINRGLLYQLLQIEKDNNKNKLKNISNPDLIKNLFEFILIMLKLKYIEKEVYEIEKSTIEIEKPVVVNANYAIFGENYKTNAGELFKLWTEFNASHTSQKKTDAIKLLTDLKILSVSTPPAPALPIYTIIQESLIVKPETDKIKTYLELKHFQAYVAYILMLKLARCFDIIDDAILATKNIDLSAATGFIKTMQDNGATIVGTSITGEPVTGDIVTSETIKRETKLMIENLESIANCTSITPANVNITKNINTINALISKIRSFLPTIPIIPPTALLTNLSRLSTLLGSASGAGGGAGPGRLLGLITESNALITTHMSDLDIDLQNALRNLVAAKGDVDAKILEIENSVINMLNADKTAIKLIKQKILRDLTDRRNELTHINTLQNNNPDKKTEIDTQLVEIKALTDKYDIDITTYTGIIKDTTTFNTRERKKNVDITNIIAEITTENNQITTNNTSLKAIYDKLAQLLLDIVHPDLYIYQESYLQLLNRYNENLNEYTRINNIDITEYDKRQNEKVNLQKMAADLNPIINHAIPDIQANLATVAEPVPADAKFVTDKDKLTRGFVELLNNYTQLVGYIRELIEGIEDEKAAADAEAERLRREEEAAEAERRRREEEAAEAERERLRLGIPGARRTDIRISFGGRRDAPLRARLLIPPIIHTGGSKITLPKVASRTTVIIAKSNTLKKIILENKTINNVLENVYVEGSNNIYILNFASIEKIGCKFKDDEMEEEEELFRTSYDLYNSLNNVEIDIDIDIDIDGANKILSNKDTNEYEITSTDDNIDKDNELLKHIIITQDAVFERHDGCHSEAYKDIEPKADRPKATVLSAFWANFGKNAEPCTSVTPATPDTQPINFKIKEKIKNILTLDPNPSMTIPKKKLIIGTGCFGPSFISTDVGDKDKRTKYIDFVYESFKTAIEAGGVVYDEIIFTIPKKSQDISKDINDMILNDSDIKNMFNTIEGINFIDKTVAGFDDAEPVDDPDVVPEPEPEPVDVPPVNEPTEYSKFIELLVDYNNKKLDDIEVLNELKGQILSLNNSENLFNDLMKDTTPAAETIKANTTLINLIVNYLNEIYCIDQEENCVAVSKVIKLPIEPVAGGGVNESFMYGGSANNVVNENNAANKELVFKGRNSAVTLPVTEVAPLVVENPAEDTAEVAVTEVAPLEEVVTPLVEEVPAAVVPVTVEANVPDPLVVKNQAADTAEVAVTEVAPLEEVVTPLVEEVPAAVENSATEEEVTVEPAPEQKLKIKFLKGTIASQIIEQKSTNPDANILAINTANALPLIGSDVEYGGEGIEEDLMRSSPELYYSLKKISKKDDNNAFYYFHNEDKIWSDDNFDKFIIETPNAKIYRNNKTNNFEVIKPESQPTATFLTVSEIDCGKNSNILRQYFINIFLFIKKMVDEKQITTLILDPISLFNNYQAAICIWYKTQFKEKFTNSDLTIIFVDSMKSTLEESNNYFNFNKEFNIIKDNLHVEGEWNDTINSTHLGGYLKNKTSRINKYKSPNNKKKNIKNTKKNNSRKQKSKKNNMSRNKSNLTKKK